MLRVSKWCLIFFTTTTSVVTRASHLFFSLDGALFFVWFLQEISQSKYSRYCYISIFFFSFWNVLWWSSSSCSSLKKILLLLLAPYDSMILHNTFEESDDHGDNEENTQFHEFRE